MLSVPRAVVPAGCRCTHPNQTYMLRGYVFIGLQCLRVATVHIQTKPMPRGYLFLGLQCQRVAAVQIQT